MMDIEDAARAYARFFEELSPETIGRIGQVCAPEVLFRDPFNEVSGIGRYRRVLEKMFEDTADPAFDIRDIAISGRTAYLRWDFRFRPKKGGDVWRIDGMSEVSFNEQGRVVSHIDHWDSGRLFYEKLPVLGFLIRLVKRRLAA